MPPNSSTSDTSMRRASMGRAGFGAASEATMSATGVVNHQKLSEMLGSRDRTWCQVSAGIKIISPGPTTVSATSTSPKRGKWVRSGRR